MPNDNHISILRDVWLIMVKLEQIVKDLPWYHKYTLGTKLKKTMQIYKLDSGVIQHKQNRKQWIESLVYTFYCRQF